MNMIFELAQNLAVPVDFKRYGLTATVVYQKTDFRVGYEITTHKPVEKIIGLKAALYHQKGEELDFVRHLSKELLIDANGDNRRVVVNSQAVAAVHQTSARLYEELKAINETIAVQRRDSTNQEKLLQHKRKEQEANQLLLDNLNERLVELEQAGTTDEINLIQKEIATAGRKQEGVSKALAEMTKSFQTLQLSLQQELAKAQAKRKEIDLLPGVEIEYAAGKTYDEVMGHYIQNGQITPEGLAWMADFEIYGQAIKDLITIPKSN